MSFKDALNKSAEAQKKLEEDTKKLTEKTSTPKKNSVTELDNTPIIEDKPDVVTTEKPTVNTKQFTGALAEYLTEEELRDMSNRKTYQTYPTIHKMVKLACNKTGKDLITYVNEAILEQLKKDDIISIYEIIHGKLK
ncbi:MAG: hypothetical protein KF732_08265 [Flavobacteriales bacterium]|nr:hypothetical protein [Flavobacteriales bacterium]HRN41686.1 hypothetical protein [Vicingus sp.]